MGAKTRHSITKSSSPHTDDEDGLKDEKSKTIQNRNTCHNQGIFSYIETKVLIVWLPFLNNMNYGIHTFLLSSHPGFWRTRHGAG
jgi:hypothetical protein